jgi:hypothetical protein
MRIKTKEKFGFLVKTTLRTVLYGPFNLLSYVLWNLSGKHGATPHCVKAHRITQIQRIFYYDTFIETGTYMGDMIDAQKKNFVSLNTIELSHDLSTRAKRRFERFRNIHVYEGDSASLLSGIVRKIHKPSIFWLDAHYSGGVTEKNKTNTPIISELQVILMSSSLAHVILIDDARYFNGESDYPTIQTVTSLVKKYRSAARIYTKDDILHIFS